jgi:NitT/TauT family transport system substrate-binding protein
MKLSIKHTVPFLLCTFLCCMITKPLASQTRITFSPQWFPQAQFAGYYVALDQGFYNELGLDVRIIHPSGTVSAFDNLKSGKVDLISSFLMDGLKERAKGMPLVHVGQLSQHSALMMVTRKSSGIDQVQELDGKKMGIWSSGFQDIPLAFMRKFHYKIQLVPILNTINLFLMGGVDALTVMWYNEYDQIINSGINEEELNTFYFSNYGFDIPEDGLFCLEDTYAEKKEALKKFMQATFKGYAYAAQNKEYAIGLVVSEMNKAHLPNNKTHQRWMLDKILDLIEPGKKHVQKGVLMKQDFQSALGLIKSDRTTQYRNTNILQEDFCK